jgi:hypothetical protein
MNVQTATGSRKALIADVGPLCLLLGMGPQDLDDPAKLLPESVEQQAEKIFRNAERVLADGGWRARRSAWSAGSRSGRGLRRCPRTASSAWRRSPAARRWRWTST